jgi:hypothetical protein
LGVIHERAREARVDLHIHSRYSDGNLSVKEIIEQAFSARLKAIAITDHDCIDAIPEAGVLGESLNIEVIPGVELSSQSGGKDIHILGYNFDPRNPELIRELSAFKEARYTRAQKMVKNLNDMGIDLRFETVEQIAGDASIGRPHIADALVREELVGSFRDAFDKYLGYESPAYVEKKKFSPEEAFSLIRRAGGVPVLAHPQVTKCDELIPELIREGLMGLEVWHSEHTAQSQTFYLEYCKKYDLISTGGSDCHGSRKGKPSIGSQPVPYECVEKLRGLKSAILVNQ